MTTPPEKLDAQTVDNQHWMPFQFLGSLHPVGRGWGANQSRACVKSTLSKSGNDQFFDMKSFDEMSRRIQWSKNEFSHSLSPKPTARIICRRCLGHLLPRRAAGRTRGRNRGDVRAGRRAAPHHQITGEPMKFLTRADCTGMVEIVSQKTTFRSFRQM
jgi:hypothetical protein